MSDARIAELHDLIVKTPPGRTATWITSGVEVTVYGQRRSELNVPTPWAVITINGRIRAIRSWEQLLDYVEAEADTSLSPPAARHGSAPD